MPPSLTIVVPVLNEAPTLADCLAALQPLRARGARVVVVDGGSDDDTLARAAPLADLALSARRGRAAQMNAGAAAAPADVLLFLHADTRLPPAADTLVQRVASGPQAWGRFDVCLDSRRPALRVIETMMNLRSRWTGIATGDQALFVRGSLFVQLGGFAEIALMEDINLSSRLRRTGPPLCLREHVVTSARRWETGGVLRTMVLMWRLRAAYFFGADPAQLARRYGYRPPSP